MTRYSLDFVKMAEVATKMIDATMRCANAIRAHFKGHYAFTSQEIEDFINILSSNTVQLQRGNLHTLSAEQWITLTSIIGMPIMTSPPCNTESMDSVRTINMEIMRGRSVPSTWTGMQFNDDEISRLWTFDELVNIATRIDNKPIQAVVCTNEKRLRLFCLVAKFLDIMHGRYTLETKMRECIAIDADTDTFLDRYILSVYGIICHGEEYISMKYGDNIMSYLSNNVNVAMDISFASTDLTHEMRRYALFAAPQNGRGRLTINLNCHDIEMYKLLDGIDNNTPFTNIVITLTERYFSIGDSSDKPSHVMFGKSNSEMTPARINDLIAMVQDKKMCNMTIKERENHDFECSIKEGMVDGVPFYTFYPNDIRKLIGISIMSSINIMLIVVISDDANYRDH